MEIPSIPTTDGGKVPVTALHDADLVVAYLSAVRNDEDKSLAHLLLYAETDLEKAGAALRRCLTGGKSLVPVYPGADEKPPKGAELVGSIPDGSLWLC